MPSFLRIFLRLLYTYHTVPLPCSAMPLCKRLFKATAQHGRSTAWYVWINISRLSTACGRQVEFRFLPNTTRSITIGSSDFSGYTWTFTKDKTLSVDGRGTVLYVWIRTTRHGRGTAWYVHIKLLSYILLKSTKFLLKQSYELQRGWLKTEASSLFYWTR